MQQTFWHDCPDAISDRGWLHAVTGPWKLEDSHSYTSATMPTEDTHSPTGWREQSSLGNYLDYGPCRDGHVGPHVHAICYAPLQTGYFETVSEAKQFIERSVLTLRPDCIIQGTLLEMEMVD